MQTEQNLRYQISELQEQWNLLSEKLSRLERDKILESRSEEKFRLENTIAETRAERQLVEQRLNNLETQLRNSLDKSADRDQPLQKHEFKWKFPFEPELFANREKEIELFFKAMREQTYLEFTGIAGQGKTYLLKWIGYSKREEDYCSAYVDFEFQRYQHPEIHPILETIVEHLLEKISPEPFLPFQNIPRSNLKPAEDTLVESFNHGLHATLESHKVVFCLDSTGKAYRTALQRFEDQVLRRYTRHKNFMLVTAGQERVKWKSPEIMDKVQSYGLFHLDHDGVLEQLTKLSRRRGFGIEDNDVISDKLLSLTFGHALSNYHLIDFWTDGFKFPLNINVVEERFAQSIKELIRRVVEDRMLRKIHLGEEYPPAKEILWWLAPLRHIEFGPLWYVLTTFLENWFKEKQFEFEIFEKLFETLTDEVEYIFTPWQLGTGHDMEPVVRNILLWDMRINASDKFLKFQEILAKQYDDWVKQSHEATQVKNIVERLYHYATYLKETQPVNLNTLIQNELKRYLKIYFIPEFTGSDVALREQLNRLYSALANDKELAKLIDIPESLSIIKGFMI